MPAAALWGQRWLPAVSPRSLPSLFSFFSGCFAVVQAAGKAPLDARPPSGLFSAKELILDEATGELRDDVTREVRHVVRSGHAPPAAAAAPPPPP